MLGEICVSLLHFYILIQSVNCQLKICVFFWKISERINWFNFLYIKPDTGVDIWPRRIIVQMQQCHKINGTWSSFWTKTLVWHGTQVVPCDTRVSCRLVKARVSIQQRWHGGLLLVRVFGKLCCHPPSSPPPPTTPTPPPPPPFSSANFSLRILLLLQM